MRDCVSLFNGYLIIHRDNSHFSVISEGRTGPIFQYYINFSLDFKNVKNNIITVINYESYCELSKAKHPAFPKTVSGWSQMTELLRFLCKQTEESSENGGVDNSKEFVLRQVTLANQTVRRYDCKDLCQAFTWYSTSRALYLQLRDVLQLPSLSTLQKLTRISKNMDDVMLFTRIIQSLPERSRALILLLDEIYVQASLEYRGQLLKEVLIVKSCFFTLHKDKDPHISVIYEKQPI